MNWKPIVVYLPMCGRQTIHGPYAALMALMIDWPIRSDRHNPVEEACLAAIDRTVSYAAAREIFLRAAREAGVEVELTTARKRRHFTLKLVAGTSGAVIP